MTQIPLNLSWRPSLSRGDFLVTQSNENAVGMIDKWPNWGAPMLILHGAAASGKTHLASVWKEISGARSLAIDETKDSGLILEPVLIDGIDPWLGDIKTETSLFHLYNSVLEADKNLLVTMRTSPFRIDFALPDLASRMRAAAIAQIQPPDDALLAGVLVKMFYDRQIDATEELISYILPRMERSFAAARDIVCTADAMALATHSKISVPLMRKVLSTMQSLD